MLGLIANEAISEGLSRAQLMVLSVFVVPFALALLQSLTSFASMVRTRVFSQPCKRLLISTMSQVKCAIPFYLFMGTMVAVCECVVLEQSSACAHISILFSLLTRVPLHTLLTVGAYAFSRTWDLT